MKFGSPEEVAYRRDLTINSLFYNIQTNFVEDFTKRGIEDLKYRRIVTPLPPKITFLDDPLRVLRAIRFGARFGYEVDEELKKTAACDDVKTVLSNENKIKRERFGIEIDFMFSGNNPLKAIKHICELTLFWIVFKLPPMVEPAISEKSHRLSANYLEATWELIQIIGSRLNFDEEKRRLCLYSALFLPLRFAIYKVENAKKVPVVNYIIRESLMLKAGDSKTIMNVHKFLDKFLSLIPSLLSNQDIQLIELEWGRKFVDFLPVTSNLRRVLTGFLLKQIKDYWPVALLISLLYPSDIIDHIQDTSNRQFDLNKRKDLFVSVENAIVNFGIEEVKPFVNGDIIKNVLHLRVGGPVVGEWKEKAFSWQLAHPSGTVEECVDWIKETVHSKRPKRD